MADERRVLALDYGVARCGCALSDPTGTLATPLIASRDPGDPTSSEDSRAAAHLLAGWLTAHDSREAG